MVSALNEMSPVRRTANISAIAVLLSFTITGSLYYLAFGVDYHFWDAMVLALIVPWGISIPLGFYMSKQRVVMVHTANQLKATQRKLKAVNRELERHANYDSLTNLFNRRKFIEEFESRRMSSNENILMIVDADYFKDINDGFGHPAGDQALILLAESFKRVLRAGDLVGRIGGEEFGILLPQTSVAEGRIIGEMVRHEVEQIAFEPEPGHHHKITVSIGITDVSPRQSRALPLRNADSALFEAKRLGRNRCIFYQPSLREKPKPCFEIVANHDEMDISRRLGKSI